MKTPKRKTMETIAGAAIGAAIAGPVGALASGLAARKVDANLGAARPSPSRGRRTNDADDPQRHARPKRILLPLDFSPPSTRALRFTREWAALFGSEVCLLHVVEPSSQVAEFGTVPAAATRGDMEAHARTALTRLATAEFPPSIRVTVLVRKGAAFDQIAAAARGIRADLIVIGTHGHTGLKHMLLGSTAERVARHAPCPVLILRRRRAGGDRSDTARSRRRTR